MKTYNKPNMEVVEIDKKDILTASGDEGTTNSGGGGFPGLPCHGQSGNQPGC